MLECPYCGELVNDDDIRECAACGIVICINCGTQPDHDEWYCDVHIPNEDTPPHEDFLDDIDSGDYDLGWYN